MEDTTTDLSGSPVTLDVILLTVVPRKVDDDLSFFKDKTQASQYAREQVQEFYGRLGLEYTQDPVDATSEVFRTNIDSALKIVGFRPGFRGVYYEGNSPQAQVVSIPVFDICIGVTPNNGEEITNILRVALDQFYVQQRDIDAGTLRVMGKKGREIVLRDLDVLRQYLPRGTQVESRTDALGGVGSSTYTL